MQEYLAPAKVVVAPEANLPDIVLRNAIEAPDAEVVARRVGGSWLPVTAAEYLAEVLAAARGLVAAGVKPGDRVALMSRTRYEWTLVDLAVWFAGAVSVPVYETSSAEQVEWILADSGAVAVVVETEEHAALVESVHARLPQLRRVLTIDAGDVAALSTRGQAVPEEEVRRRAGALRADDVATIIYTSGTTGRPKGCELTHGNFRAEVDNAVAHLPDVLLAEGAACLLFLPLAHVLARDIQLICLAARVRLGHAEDVRNVSGDLASFRPTLLLVVPRVLEKVYNAAEQRAQASGRGRVFAAAAATAIAYSSALDAGGPGVGLRLRHALFDRLVYGKLRAALGGRTRYAVSGGAALGERLSHFFRGVGVLVLEGYGLTETSAAAAVNTPKDFKVGSVGKPMPGTAVRIGEGGEVLVKGPIVFRGYYGDTRATSDVLTGEGWFHTGDLGELDAEGFLRIRGRSKEILVTSAGKNVAPGVLEDRLRAHPLVSACLVVGDARPYIAALVTLDAEALPGWLERHGKPVRPVAELVEDPHVLAEVQAAVDEANTLVSRAESIRRFRILPCDFTEQDGHVTPTLKLKRHDVLRDFAADVEALYPPPSSPAA